MSVMRLSNVIPSTSNVGRTQRVRKFQLRVGEQREWQLEPLRGLALIVGVLRGEPKTRATPSARSVSK